MTGHACFLALIWRSDGGETDFDSVRVSWRSKLMPTAARMVIGNALIWRGGDLILITIIMAGCLGGHWNTVEPLGRVRSCARPKHQDKHHGAKKGGPTDHLLRP